MSAISLIEIVEGMDAFTASLLMANAMNPQFIQSMQTAGTPEEKEAMLKQLATLQEKAQMETSDVPSDDFLMVVIGVHEMNISIFKRVLPMETLVSYVPAALKNAEAIETLRNIGANSFADICAHDAAPGTANTQKKAPRKPGPAKLDDKTSPAKPAKPPRKPGPGKRNGGPSA